MNGLPLTEKLSGEGNQTVIILSLAEPNIVLWHTSKASSHKCRVGYVLATVTYVKHVILTISMGTDYCLH